MSSRKLFHKLLFDYNQKQFKFIIASGQNNFFPYFSSTNTGDLITVNNCDKKAIIYVSSSFMFCKSLLWQAPTPLGIVPVTLDLTMGSTFSILMWGIVYDNVSEAKLWLSPRSNILRTTRWRSFNINRRSLNRDVLRSRGKSVAKFRQLQLHGNTTVMREATVAD